MAKTLFIADKWCAGNESFGLSEWEGNLYSSFVASDIGEAAIFHYDEYFKQNGKKGDNALLELIDRDKPDIIILVIYKMPSSSTHVLEWETLKMIRLANIPVVAIWGDLEMEEQVAISKAILPYVSFNAATASSAAVERIGDPDRYIYLWVPKDPTYFNDPGSSRDIDISYSGSPKKERLKRIEFLKKHGIDVVTGGGERQEHKTTRHYAEVYQRSKIALSFSRANLSHVVNARPFEALLCGAMLLEEESFELPKLYTPYIDYIPYANPKDLLEKARYYLAHDAEREKIAKSGMERTKTHYSSKKFWQLIMKQALNPVSPLPSLFHCELPKNSPIKLKLLDCISRSAFLFAIYKLLQPGFYKERFIRFGYNTKLFLENKVSQRQMDFILNIKRKLW